MTKRTRKNWRKRPAKPQRPQQLLAVCYALGAALWLLYCLVGCGILLNHKMNGSMVSRTLTADELDFESFISYDESEWHTAPDERAGWYLSTDNDPHIYWQGSAYLETVCLQAEHYLPAGSVALYYLLPGQTDYSEAQKVFAHQNGAGRYLFELGGKSVAGLRIDPDSVGGVPTRLSGVELNVASPWYLRFVPNAGQWLLLAFGPAVAAAFLGILAQAAIREDG